jgi:hypothetical protein
MPEQVAHALWYCLEAVVIVATLVVAGFGLLLVRIVLEELGIWP